MVQVTTFVEHKGLMKAIWDFQKNIDAISAQMVAFMNSDECGPVNGVSITNDFPGFAYAVVLHGDPGGVESKTWTCAATHEIQGDGGMNLVSRDNAYKGFDKAVKKLLAEPIANSATFGTVCCSDVSSHGVLFAPDTNERGVLQAETFMGEMPGILVCAPNLTGAVTAMAPAMAIVITTRNTVDISVGSTDTGAYGAVWYRDGGSAGSKEASTASVWKTGVITRGLYHKVMDTLSEMLKEYKGKIFFDLDSTKVVCHGLVFHDGGEGQPPAENKGALASSSCCVIS
uniref:Uncharacterized protein n=1 Tax=Chromera velia CCMP2878 TaxID=1169474 RepID=A0A0G4HCN5_9ALVE|eukprot:Cvel_26213.t1-p1 / transcript=Cvel_26213.t1 / gene=Cvel_26213 / organism=Chromera_velia_CCMP2878 / gene_product=hypothetical protein / transcript_product=hypothetical protein / location=Cvel_scaffold3087:16221-17284(-) / protein_length=285 / sequence_SO=supercontig / SO=protein_coding / is_pseudo=false